MNFDMNRTWAQALALLQANFQLLALISGVFLLLPSALVYIALPDLMTAMTTATDPEAMIRLLEQSAVPLALLAGLGTLAQMIGYLAMIALMGDERPTVGEALRRGLRLLPSAIGATLLLALAYVAAALLLGLVLGLIVGAAQAIGGGALAGVLTALGVIAMLVAIVYIVTRFTMTMPAIVLDGLGNPLAALRRSWELTARHALRIFGFYALLVVAYLVISLVLGSIVGLLAAALGNAAASALVLGLANGVIAAGVAMLFSAILVSMHQQLTGASPTAIDITFG